MALILNILLFISLALGAVFMFALGLWAIVLPFWALSQAFGTSDAALKEQLAESQALLASSEEPRQQAPG
ncbi:MAG: hypothetical protein WC247_10335 [Porticoccaceae bacterium]